MTNCGKSSIFDNSKYKDLLSDEKFIEFLISKLESRGFGGGLPITLIEGNKIKIDDNSIEDIRNEFIISFLEIAPPLATITLNVNSIERGILIPPNSISITASYTRKTYRLKSVNFDGITGVVDLTEVDLTDVQEDERVEVTGNNSLTIARLDTKVAEIEVIDTNNNLVRAVANISRPTRWYWGITNNPNLNEIDVNEAFATGLGNPPSTISPNVGNGNYVWVATIGSSNITDTTLKVSQVEERIIRQIQPVSGYFVDYNIQRTDLKSGGTINLLIS